MNRSYVVKWAAVAGNDLKDIVSYIAADSTKHALDVLKKIEHKASSLYSMPYRGHIVPELLDQGITLYRELIVAPWRIIYRVAEHEVFVLSVLDARQNVEDILLRRLIGRL